MRSAQTVGLLAGVPWRTVAGLASAGLALLLVASVWVAAPVADLALRLGIVALAASAAHVLDEAAAEAVDATPTSLRTRTVTRSACAAVLLAAGVGGLGLVALRSDSSARLAVASQLVGCVLVAVVVAAVLRRRLAEPGEVVSATVAAVILMLSLAHPFDRWVDLFPSGATDRFVGSLAVWSLVALTSGVVLARATRDPYDRHV
jgi:hypothetical protein